MADKQKGLVQILALLVILVGIAVGLILVRQQTTLKSKASEDKVDLSFQPPQMHISPGQALTVDIFAYNHNLTISAAELNLNFDSSMLEFKSLTAGSLLPTILKAPSTQNGSLSVTLGANPAHLSASDGPLATITFTAKPTFTGSSTISLTGQTQVTVINHTANSLGQVSSAVLSLASTTGPSSPSPIATSTPSPSPDSASQITPSSPRGYTLHPEPNKQTPYSPSTQMSLPPSQTAPPQTAYRIISEERNQAFIASLSTPTPSPAPTTNPIPFLSKITNLSMVKKVNYLIQAVTQGINDILRDNFKF